MEKIIEFYQPTAIRALRSWTRFASEEPEVFADAIVRATKRSEESKLSLPYKIPTTDYEVEIKDEEYLRPSPYCEADAKEIIGMAVKLGAFDKRPKEYAEAVFNFVKDKVMFGFSPEAAGALNCFKSGIGGPADKTSLFIALCRVGGIPSRYKLTAEIEFEDKLHEFVLGIEGFGEFYGALKEFFPMHVDAEVRIDDKWIPADLTFNSEVELAMDYPLSQLGMDPTGSWEIGHRGNILYRESLPPDLWNLYGEILKAFPGAVKSINDAFAGLTAKGKKVLDGADEREKRERAMKGIRSYDELTEELVNKLKGIEE